MGGLKTRVEVIKVSLVGGFAGPTRKAVYVGYLPIQQHIAEKMLFGQAWRSMTMIAYFSDDFDLHVFRDSKNGSLMLN